MTLKVAEENGKCRTSLRCMDPDSETWFQDLVDFLAPDDPTGDAARDGYPLPELPSLGTTPEPPVAAPAPSPGPAERDAPHVPSRSAARRRWKAAWQRMKPLVAQGKSNDYIVGWFMKHSDDIQPSKESVIRIIAAGEAGLLE